MTYIIAEIGSNHQRDLNTAHELIKVAAGAGVNCLKAQLFSPDFYDGAHDHALPPEWLPELAESCSEHQVDFLCSGFSKTDLDAIAAVSADAVKIASPELVDHDLIRHAAQLFEKVYLSTGMALLADVEEALLCCKPNQAVLLHCVTQYPARPRQMNLRAMHTMRRCFGTPVGLSDHSEGIAIAIAAAALGAEVIEKHFTMDRTQPGPDHAYAIEPDELFEMVQGIRDVRLALGDGRKRPQPGEMLHVRGRTIG